MKSLFEEYYKVIMYTIFGLMLTMASYCIILNVHHYNAISEEIVVSDIDSDYLEYINNVNKIEENLSNITDANLLSSITKTVNVMKKSGVFRLVPKTKLNYHELYDLNDYFIEKLINDCWVTNLKQSYLNTSYNNSFDMLISNANYINSILGDNGIVIYESKNKNRIIDDYHYILRNYVMYSRNILDIINSSGGNNDQDN